MNSVNDRRYYMKCISWNVNGIRSTLKKGFVDILYNLDADIVCVQETKAQPEQIKFDCDLYPYRYFYSAEKKGYSGTMILAKEEPLSVECGVDHSYFDTEGRVITLEYPDFYVVTVYTPTSGDGCKRLNYRLQWDIAFSHYVNSLNKPTIICGDLNVANENIDIISPMFTNCAGFTAEERLSFRRNLLNNYIDTYRYLYPKKIQYTWWCNYNNARQKDYGWRLDYWLVSKDLKDKIVDSKILDNIYGSDHCPIELDIDL